MRALLLVAFLVPVVLPAQGFRDSTISITTTRSIRVAPDRATMYLLVEGSAETPRDAVARVETKLKAVTDAVNALTPRPDVDRPMIISTGPTPPPNMYPAPAGPPTHLSRAVIRVQMNRIDQIAQVGAAALTAGAAGVSSITFQSSVADSIRRARATDAIAVARADATALATALEGRLGTLIDLSSTGPTFDYYGPTQLNFDGRFFQPPQVPEINIVATVSIRYKLLR